jgi:DNA-binding CsgD family transcriptional regulator
MSGLPMPGEARAALAAKTTLLELIGDVCGLLDIEELRWGMLAAIGRAFPSDYISLNDIGPHRGEVVAIAIPPIHEDDELLAVWQRLAHQNPLLQYQQRTLDGRAKRFSDVISQDELHQLDLYRELYAPLGVEYQMAFSLPTEEGRVLAIALSRTDRDYSDAERDLANEARPFLIQAYVNALSFTSLRERDPVPPADEVVRRLLAEGLTRREAEVLRLLALGGSNRHIATALKISARTVAKHLEHGFRKLDVGDRSAAAERVWTIVHDGRSERSRGVMGRLPALDR